jgi:hypothetical protein
LLSVYSVAACTLALSPIRDTLIEGFSHFVTSMTAPIASGWSDCRVGLAPTGKRRLCTAHARSGHSHENQLQLACGRGFYRPWLRLRIGPASHRCPGSPGATTTITGKQLPPPPPRFGGVIREKATDSKSWWAPRTVPPKGAPNVLLIMTDDAGFGAPGTFGGVVPTPALDRIAEQGLRCSLCRLSRFIPLADIRRSRRSTV